MHVIAATVMLVAASPAAAQVVTVEGGLAGIAAGAGPFVESAGGGFVGADVEISQTPRGISQKEGIPWQPLASTHARAMICEGVTGGTACQMVCGGSAWHAVPKFTPEEGGC